MMYYLLYTIMLVGFLGLSIQNPDLKGKMIGILLTIVNALLFWK